MKAVGCAHEAVNTNAYSLVLMIVTSFNANGFVGVSFALLLENNTTKMWTAASLYMYARMFREKYIGQAQEYVRLFLCSLQTYPNTPVGGGRCQRDIIRH